MNTAHLVPLAIIFAIILIGAVTGIYAGLRHTMDLEQWTVAGRGFGLVFVWLLAAGEIYTTFSFLGSSGWVYSKGGPTLYILGYMTLAYVIGFFILPDIWEVGSRFRLHTISDFFQQRYGSKYLGAVVAIVGVVFIVPYLQLQLTGLGIIVEIASLHAIGRTAAMLIAFVVVAGFVFSSGVRAVAWVSVLKDSLMLIAALVVGIGIPFHYFGGIRPMFHALTQAKPAFLTMPGGTTNLGHAWYISVVLLSAFGFYMWPQGFGSVFSARSGDTLRRNAIVMPLYTFTLPLLFCVGFTAVLVLPGLKSGDLALLTIVRNTFPGWLLGLIGGAGALTAMVPAAIMLLTAATLFAKNFVRPLFRPEMQERNVTRLAKCMVIVLTGVALYFAIFSSTTLVALLLLSYAGVTQFLPGVLFALYWPRATTAGVLCGILAGVGLAMVLMVTRHDPFYGLNAGFVALCVNFLTSTVVSVLTPVRANGFEEVAAAAAAD